MTYAPWIILFCVTYWALWECKHRRLAEAELAARKAFSTIIDELVGGMGE